jgi:hypothetical protein
MNFVLFAMQQQLAGEIGDLARCWGNSPLSLGSRLNAGADDADLKGEIYVH